MQSYVQVGDEPGVFLDEGEAEFGAAAHQALDADGGRLAFAVGDAWAQW